MLHSHEPFSHFSKSMVPMLGTFLKFNSHFGRLNIFEIQGWNRRPLGYILCLFGGALTPKPVARAALILMG